MLLDDFVQSYLGGNLQRLTGRSGTDGTPEIDLAAKKRSSPPLSTIVRGERPSKLVRPDDTEAQEGVEPDQVEDFML